MAKLYSTLSKPFRYLDDGTIELTLTNGYVSIISADDAEIANPCWYAHKTKGKIIYAYRNSTTVNGMRSGLKLHRVILARMLGRALTPDEHVDHRNGDGLFNTRGNLRLADFGVNAFNKNRRVDNTSGISGVVWSKEHRQWVVRIDCNHKRIHLGYFDNLEDAIAARLAAEKEYFGEFAPSLSRGT